MSLRYSLFAGTCALLGTCSLVGARLSADLEAFREQEQVFREGERLDADRFLLLESAQVLAQAQEEVACGRTSLAEAVAVHRAEDQRRPSHLRMRPERVAGRSEEECYWRMVAHLIVALRDGKPDQPALRARLEADLQRRFASQPSLLAERQPTVVVRQ